MKKLFFAVIAVLFAVTASAQTSVAERIEKLKAEVPAACGVSEIDHLVAKCKEVAHSTVDVRNALTALKGDSSKEKVGELKGKVKLTGTELGEAGKLLGGATGALKSLKNPLKLKPAGKSIAYAEKVIESAGEELAAQEKELAALVK